MARISWRRGAGRICIFGLSGERREGEVRGCNTTWRYQGGEKVVTTVLLVELSYELQRSCGIQTMHRDYYLA